MAERRRQSLTTMIVGGSGFALAIGSLGYASLALLGLTPHLGLAGRADQLGWLLDLLLSTVSPVWLLIAIASHGMGVGSHRAMGLLLHVIAATLVMMARTGFAIVEGLPAIGMVLGILVLVALAAAAVGKASGTTRWQNQPVVLPLARGGVLLGRLMIAAVFTGFVLVMIDQSGLAFDLAPILVGATGEGWLPLMALAALLSFGMGCALPPLAAYLIAMALLDVALRTAGAVGLFSHIIVLMACSAGATLRYVLFGQAALGVAGRLSLSSVLPGKAASR